MQNRSKRTAALVLAALGMFPCASRAVVVDATWIDGNSSWHNPAGWNIGVVPNNSGGTSYNATIPTSVVTYTAPPIVTIDNLNVGAAATLHIAGPFSTTVGARVDGQMDIDAGPGGGGTFTVGSSGLLTGSGTLTIGPGPGFGTLLTSASALSIDDATHLTVRLGAIGTINKPLINRGFVAGGFGTVGSFGSRLSFSSIQNLGTIEARGGPLRLDGTFTRADLGNLQWGSNGVFQIGPFATMNNVGQTFRVEVDKPWFLSGTINGGTVQIDPGANLSIPYFGGAVLNNVIVNGRIFHGGGRPLLVEHLMGNAEFELENEFIEGPSRIKADTSMTIDASVLVHGAGGHGFPDDGTPGSGLEAATAIVNHGTIRSDSEWGLSTGPINGEFALVTPSLINDGKLATLANSWLYASGNITFAPGGVLDVQMSPTTDLGVLRVAGSLDLTTAGDSLSLSTSSDIQANTFYRIVTTAGGVVGQFDSVTLGFEVEYRNGTEIWARFVPEPTSALLGCGISFLAFARRPR